MIPVLLFFCTSLNDYELNELFLYNSFGTILLVDFTTLLYAL